MPQKQRSRIGAKPLGWAGVLMVGALLGGARAQTPGSAANQTLLVVSPRTLRGPITVTLNGKRVGDFAGFGRLDVSNYVRVGENNLQVTSPDRRGVGFAKIAHAVTKDAFRDITEVRMEGFRATAEGTRAKFTLPTGAGGGAKNVSLAGRSSLSTRSR
ncbi:hypothetical protein V3W47_03925 [Deinococcus sp. YIM 134068]|uniref:hypothetical protein n=1 Tax=Deinococcus lichenicola TaxID=3118910 RepID=UPI002F93CAA4